MGFPVQELLANGVEAQKSGKTEDAKSSYLAVLELEPNNPDANFYMGILSANNNELEDALLYFQIAIKVQPSVEKYWLPLIQILIKIGRYDDAEKYINAAEKQRLISLKDIIPL